MEVLAKPKSDAGLLLAYQVDGPGLTPGGLKIWELTANERTFLGTIESLPAGKSVRVEIFPSGRPAETIAAPGSSWALSDALSPLNLAFAALKDPEGTLTVGLISQNRTPNQPPLHFSSSAEGHLRGRRGTRRSADPQVPPRRRSARRADSPGCTATKSGSKPWRRTT